MTNTTHTPGPWRVSGYRLAVFAKLNGIKVVIADCNRTLGYSESEANARLLAAAPDLLEALKQCRLALEPYDDVKPRDWKTDREKLAFAHQAARAAIAKATGDQP